MSRVAFRIFGIDIMWYGIIMAFAMISAVLFAMKNAKKIGILEDDILDLSLLALPLAVVGARVYYVLFNLSLYENNWWNIFNTRLGGMAVHGGLIGGFIGGVIIAVRKKLNVIKTADLIAPSISLGQAIGRWGNFINQEAHGGPTNLPWGILVDGVRVHPTFLYESLWNIGVLGLLMYYFKRKKYDGQLVAIYLIGYSIGRFFIEGLRTDSLMIGPFRTAQLVSLIMIAAGIMVHWYFRGKGIHAPYMKERRHGV